MDTRGLEPRFFHVAFWRDPSTLHRFRARKVAVGAYLHTTVFTSVLLTLLILPVRSYPGPPSGIRTLDTLIKSQVLWPAELRADICDEFTYHHLYSHDNLPNFCGATVALARGRCPRVLTPLQLITACSRPDFKVFPYHIRWEAYRSVVTATTGLLLRGFFSKWSLFSCLSSQKQW